MLPPAACACSVLGCMLCSLLGCMLCSVLGCMLPCATCMLCSVLALHAALPACAGPRLYQRISNNISLTALRCIVHTRAAVHPSLLQDPDFALRLSAFTEICDKVRLGARALPAAAACCLLLLLPLDGTAACWCCRSLALVLMLLARQPAS